MSAQSDDGFPTRSEEIGLLSTALDGGFPILGVCLGAQLLAVAAGGRVTEGNAGQEIGWENITLRPGADDDLLFSGLPSTFGVLHWHGETYELDSSATRLASSARYLEQAFRCGERAWGLQFHLEVDLGAVEIFVDNFGQEARRAGVNPTEIRAEAPAALGALSPLRDRLLRRFANLIIGSDPAAVGGRQVENA